MTSFIIDTNALLDSPEILKTEKIVITSMVLRELEALERKKGDRQLQLQIRNAKRALDEYSPSRFVDIKDYKSTLYHFDDSYVDNIILSYALKKGFGIITNDRLLEYKCRVYDIEVKSTSDNSFVEHKGFKEVVFNRAEYADFNENLDVNKYGLLENEYLIISTHDSKTPYVWTGEYHEEVVKHPRVISEQFGELEPKDVYQKLAIDSIIKNDITSIRGKAGSGKSLIALSTLWHLLEQQKISKIVIFTNPVAVGNAQELGFYKGDRLEKLMQTIGTMLISKFGDEHGILRAIEDKKLEILPFADIRGYDTSSESKVGVWIVESQNLTTELLKVGLQRLGDNTKVVVDGDYHAQTDKAIYGIDNGMKRMSEVFRGKKIYGEIELQNIYRSEIAEIADEM